MLMPKKNLVAIYEHLFKEGVMVAKKDVHAAKHPELEAVPNLHVMKALNVSSKRLNTLYNNFQNRQRSSLRTTESPKSQRIRNPLQLFSWIINLGNQSPFSFSSLCNLSLFML